jgi:hypothetical protein
VLSNLLYHKYLDPDEGKILKSLAATQEKFLIHAQPDKARHLRSEVAWWPIVRPFKVQMEVSLQIVQMARTNIKILFMFPQV